MYLFSISLRGQHWRERERETKREKDIHTDTPPHKPLVPTTLRPSASLPHLEAVMPWLQVKPLVASWWH